MSNVPDKEKAVDSAITQIERQFGKGSIMKLGSMPVIDVPIIPSGSIALDQALGVGGLPRGRVIEIYGPESSGKTTLALHAVANAQKQGGIAAFIDAEHALDTKYAKKLGVNCDELLVAQPDTGEQALEIADMLVRSGAIDYHGYRFRSGSGSTSRNRRRYGRFPYGFTGTPDVAGAAQADRDHQQNHDVHHIHQPNSYENWRCVRQP